MTSDHDGWRHSNIGRLLNNSVRRFEARVLELLWRHPYPNVRLSHIQLTRNLDVAGTRITELARRADITKQAMGELVAQCEALGLVLRTPDPQDGRAAIIMFTPLGLEWLSLFRSAITQAEKEMREELGYLRVDAIAAALKTYSENHDPLESINNDNLPS
jgi:DNA-binding MarR family transcriptional regulator